MKYRDANFQKTDGRLLSFLAELYRASTHQAHKVRKEIPPLCRFVSRFVGVQTGYVPVL
jgi:hypothetical protein